MAVSELARTTTAKGIAKGRASYTSTHDDIKNLSVAIATQTQPFTQNQNMGKNFQKHFYHKKN